ncbi:MAG: hypothetical protein WBE38_17385 [Terracidiphilus sp.]
MTSNKGTALRVEIDWEEGYSGSTFKGVAQDNKGEIYKVKPW